MRRPIHRTVSSPVLLVNDTQRQPTFIDEQHVVLHQPTHLALDHPKPRHLRLT
ncbi:hypothetical protein [Halomicronema sp. CCY15110]|uniref:hypothetical protein n=1 Tax=Halomicronema sp. CCY15110 TaxID=2767773 RepID=UPI0019507790|nr:hypothetical protein [Halomicronema sp. CCY15110]